MQKIDTCFNNINVSFSIDNKDKIIKCKEKHISIYSEDIKKVIRHLYKIIFGSKVDEVYILNKYTQFISNDQQKNKQPINKHILEDINELEPDLVLSSELAFVLSTSIAQHFYNPLRNNIYQTTSQLFNEYDLINDSVTQDNEFNLQIKNNTSYNENDIEQLNKYSSSPKYQTSVNVDANTSNAKKQKVIINELLLLKSTFINKKRLIVTIPEEVTEISLCYIVYIILNQEWLISNCLKIQLDFSNCALQSNQNNIYTVLLVIFLMYFIIKKNLKAMHNLSIIIPYAYTIELNQYFENNKEIQFTSTLHLLEFLNAKIHHLNQLSIAFNAIDSLTFQTIISIIFNNTQIRTLSLKLFPSDSSSSLYFSIQHLMHYCSKQNITIQNGNFLSMDSLHFDEPEYFLNKLLKTFQVNLDLFIYSLSLNPHHLTELILDLELPSVILLSEKYIEALLKIFFKLMNYIESSMNSIISLEIKAPNFPFDANKYIDIDDEIENFKMTNNKLISNLVLDVKMAHLNNLHMIIPSSVKSLVLGEVDNETLEDFSDNIESLKELGCLRITLSNYDHLDIEKNWRVIKMFIKSLRKTKLESVAIVFKVYLTSDVIRQIMKVIDGDYVQRYSFSFYRSNIKYSDDDRLNDFEKDIRIRKYYYNKRPSEIYYVYYAFAMYQKKKDGKKIENNKENKGDNNCLSSSIQSIIKRVQKFIQIPKAKHVKLMISDNYC